MSISRTIAAVCCYFNPCQYLARLKNYDEFRRRAAGAHARLLTVELAFGEQPFQLTAYPDVIRLRGGDVLWQKERLLQIGINILLNEGYDCVAWLDADIIFEDDAWPGRICKALDEYRVVQCFSTAAMGYSDRNLHCHSAAMGASAFRRRRVPITHGLAWAARADVLREAGLYQHCVVGGGDSAFYYGCRVLPDVPETQSAVMRRLPMSAGSFLFRQHYSQWALRLGELVQGRVGYVDQCVAAMSHGSVVARGYADRHAILGQFDPYTDVRVGESGAWEWASCKQDLHTKVWAYFANRKEDD